MIIEDGVLKRVKNDEIVNGTIIIPEGVTSIGDGAFGACENLTEIEIPEGVASIGSGAFGGCENLTEIGIPEGVTSIGNRAFDGCKNLTKIEIPEGVTSIGNRAFWGCKNLTKIEIPEGVTSIGDSAFYGCKNLTEIEIPEGVTSIGYSAFWGCENLTEIVIPEGVTSIGNSAFWGCKNLTKIEIPEGVTSIGINAFSGCISLTKIEIPEGVTSIGDSAFYGCKNLTEIEIPEGVTSIGDSAFYGCKNLKEIEIPEGVTSIGDSAFCGCKNLKEIEIPEGVTSISKFAFYGCENLTEIEIPEGVTSISNFAFYGCENLTEIVIPDGVGFGDLALHPRTKVLGAPDTFTFGEYAERMEKIKRKDNFHLSDDYVDSQMNEFYVKMINSIGIDEVARIVEMQDNIPDRILKRYMLEKDDAFKKLYDIKYNITGDLGNVIALLKSLNLKGYKDNGQAVMQNINRLLKDNPQISIKQLIENCMSDQVGKDKSKIFEKLKSINKKMINTNLEQVKDEIVHGLMTNDLGEFSIVNAQIEPIRKMIEDVARKEFMENGEIDKEEFIKSMQEKLSNANAPYINQNCEQILKKVVDVISQEGIYEKLNHTLIDSLKQVKENIPGKGWRYQLEQAFNAIGYNFGDIGNDFGISDEQIQQLKEEFKKRGINIEIETEENAVLKDEEKRQDAFKLLKEKGAIVTYKQIHDMFGPVHEPYSEEFKKFYMEHKEEFLENPEYYEKFGTIHNNFKRIINSLELKNVYERGELEISQIISYLKTNQFVNQRPGDEDLARLSSTVGNISTEEQFSDVQKIFDITRKRERTSVPPMKVMGKNGKFRGRMLSPDDVHNLFAGNLTKCCQKFGDVRRRCNASWLN